MPTMSEQPSLGLDEVLELPALDGTDETETEDAAADGDELDLGEQLVDPYDDQADGDVLAASLHELGELLDERTSGAHVDADDPSAVDVGGFELAFDDEDADLRDDRPTQDAAAFGGDEDLDAGEHEAGADTGEEGPLSDDEDLREEDLPALDSDEDGDAGDGAFLSGPALGESTAEGLESLRWADRAWTRADAPADAPESDDARDQSGALLVPGDDPASARRDAAWRTLEASGAVTAACALPGGAVVLALAVPTSGKAWLVRIGTDGVAAIVAEIEPSDSDEDGDGVSVADLAFHGPRCVVVARGVFGAAAFRPS